MKEVAIYLLGWAIDSHWDEKQNKNSPNRHSIMPVAIERNITSVTTHVVPLCLKDGRDIDSSDLKKLQEQWSEKQPTLIIGWVEVAADALDFLLRKKTQTSGLVFWSTLSPWDQDEHVKHMKKAIDYVLDWETGIFFKGKIYTSQKFRVEVLFKKKIS